MRNMPILLSIGYSACHWCHVMAHESFESEATARLMNEHFVCIKVDREERPDLASPLHGRGPIAHGPRRLAVDRVPDVGRRSRSNGGTYFPPEDRYGVPAFPRVLSSIARAYRDTPDEVAKAGRPAHGGTAQDRRRRQRRTDSRREAVAGGAAGIGTSLRRSLRGHRAGSEIPPHAGIPAVPAPVPEFRRPAVPRDGDQHLASNGGGGDLRSAGWRLPPLFGRPAVAGCPTSRRCCTTRPFSSRST